MSIPPVVIFLALLYPVVLVARRVVKKMRLSKLNRIQEAMPSRACPNCWSSDMYGGQIKDNIVPMECRVCHHSWTVKIPSDLIKLWKKSEKQRVA